jgi:hypothetical protein
MHQPVDTEEDELVEAVERALTKRNLLFVDGVVVGEVVEFRPSYRVKNGFIYELPERQK